jgi:hypothetical protein
VAVATLVALAVVPAGTTLRPNSTPPPVAGAGGHAMSATWSDSAAVTAAGDRRSRTGATLGGADPDEVAIIPPPAAFDAQPEGLVPAPASLRASMVDRDEGGVWAVVVGIDDYPGRRSDLRASVNDADATEAALLAYGVPASRIVVLRNGEASAATIRASLGWLVQHAGRDATAVFFYAGHIRKLAPGREAIVAADGELVTDADVAWDLKHLRAEQTWIALAACYAGGFTEVLAPGRILTGAADSSSLAYESAAYGRSYLAEFMIQRAMRNGWAAGSIEEAFAWAQEELRREHPKRVLVQHDMVDGELVLGTPPPPQPFPQAQPTTASAPPPEPSPQAPPPEPEPESPPPPPPGEPAEDSSCLLGVLGDCRDE